MLVLKANKSLAKLFGYCKYLIYIIKLYIINIYIYNEINPL